MLLIREAKVATAGGLLEADLLVGDEGRIERVGKRLSVSATDEVVNAAGQWLLPGAIDGHVHFREPGSPQKETMDTGSAAALAGGVTTVLEMPNTSPPVSTPEAYQAKRELAGKGMRCDYGLYYGATAANQVEAARSGALLLKVYAGATTGDLLVDDSAALFEHFSHFPGTVAVHAEDNSLMKHFGGQYSPSAENHPRIRAPVCEQAAAARVLAFAQVTNARVHLAHASTPQTLELVAAARKRGARVTCEVTPHHLFLHEGAIRKLGNYGKMNPPLRSKSDVAGLWHQLRAVDALASDHAPHTREEKEQDYKDAPSGVPGVETLLPLLLDAVLRKKLSLGEAVRLTSAGPARAFSLESKGRLASGYACDLVLFNPKGTRVLRERELFTKCGWSPFEGFELKGRVERVYLRGRLAFDGEFVVAQPGWGQHVVAGE